MCRLALGIVATRCLTAISATISLAEGDIQNRISYDEILLVHSQFRPAQFCR